jgi:hypothetical protein
MTTREQIFSALFALGQGVNWADPVSGDVTTWSTTSRRIQTPDQIGIDGQPALLQAESDEQFSQVTKMPSKRTFSAAWVIYLKPYDAPDPTGPLINTVMDAVEAAFAPDDVVNGVCTLGGLVAHCWIDGTVFRDPGDLDQQAMLVVPIKMLAP